MRKRRTYTNNRDYVKLNGYHYGYEFYLFAGNDYLSVHADASTINAGLGNDTVYLIGAYNQIAMHDGNDLFELSAGNNNNINLGGGNDQAKIYGSSNTINGGSGNDALTIKGNNNLVFFGQDNDAISVLGNNNTLLDGHESSYETRISVKGNGNRIDNSSHNNITVFHDGNPGWNETSIHGAGNFINIDTATITQSPSPGIFTHGTSVKVRSNGRNWRDNLGIAMNEGRKVNLVMDTPYADIIMDFGTAGANNKFDPFAFSLEVYRQSNVLLTINAPNAKLSKLPNSENNDIRYLLSTQNDVSKPYGFINLSQLDGKLNILLNTEIVFSHG